MSKLTQDEIRALATQIIEGQEPPPDPPFDFKNAEPPPPDTEPDPFIDWEPEYGETQKRAAYDPTPVKLYVGEKGSGKSHLALTEMVQHCYDNDNALAVIITTTRSVGTHGAVYELENFVLPKFAHGNPIAPYNLDGTVNPDAEMLEDGSFPTKDSGIGLMYTPIRTDPISKDSYLYIRNKYGRNSTVLIKSILYPSHVRARFTGITPSFVLIDEITETTSAEYFTYISIQLGRRRGVKGPQQFIATCNPKGPNHWVYKTFHVEKSIKNETEHPAPGFAVYHIPLDENLQWINPDYRRLLEQRLHDPIERLRLIDGQWIEQPSGDAIFSDVWFEDIHVVGDSHGNDCIIPWRQFPCVIGWDPGPANFSVTFLQPVPTSAGRLWTIFDEVDLVGLKMPYSWVVKAVLKRMDYWNNKAGIGRFYHVIDDAAFTHTNSRGSFDSTEILQHGEGRITLNGCPKGKDSVPTRVREIKELLAVDLIKVSGHCIGAKSMFTHLESEHPKEGKYDSNEGFVPKRSPFIHRFDSASYVIHYSLIHPAARYWTASEQDIIKPMIYRAGRG